MRKIWTIAKREYGAMVATKAFLISIALMPVLMFGGIFIASRAQKVGDVRDKVIVVVDGTGGLLSGDLEQSAANLQLYRRQRRINSGSNRQIHD